MIRIRRAPDEALYGCALRWASRVIRPKWRRPAMRLLESAGGADAGVIAMDGSEVIGFMRWRENGHARGTWVAPAWRRHGLAIEMWKHFAKSMKGRPIQVTTVSRNGHRLVRLIQQRYPHWQVKEDPLYD